MRTCARANHKPEHSTCRIAGCPGLYTQALKERSRATVRSSRSMNFGSGSQHGRGFRFVQNPQNFWEKLVFFKNILTCFDFLT